MTKPKIVCVGLYRPGTGFTRVLTAIIEGLKKDYEIHWVGIGYKGEILNKEYRIYPCNKEGGDMFGSFKARQLVDELNAEFLFLLNDFWMIKNYNVTFKEDFKTIKIAYIPLDGYITDASQTGDVSVLNHIVFYSEFAYNQYTTAIHKAGLAHSDLDIIPHGVDTSKFFPLDLAAQVLYEKRIQVFDQSIITRETKIILNANRYSERKDIETCIRGFAVFIERYQTDALLVLHQPGVHPFHLEILNRLVSELSLNKHVIINPFGHETYLNDEDLNLLFNLCDIGINTSLGEGWGMISFEHGACKKPQIVPNHTVFPELWDQSAMFLEVSEDIELGNNPFLMKKSSVESIATSIHTLLTNQSLYDILTEKAFQNAKRTDFSWDNIALKWKNLFESYHEKIS